MNVQGSMSIISPPDVKSQLIGELGKIESLKTSGSAELSEGAGSKNRLLHVLLTWPGRVQALAGQKALREDHPKALFSQT